MDRSPLHPLRLLPALLATADQGRRYFENEIGQWLAAQAEGEARARASAPEATVAVLETVAVQPGHPADGTANVPNTGETIPEPGQ